MDWLEMAGVNQNEELIEQAGSKVNLSSIDNVQSEALMIAGNEPFNYRVRHVLQV